MAREDDSLSVAEAARRIGVNPETVRLWIVEGKLEAFRNSPRRRARWRVRVEDLEAMLKKRETEPTPDAPPRPGVRPPSRFRSDSGDPVLEMLINTDLVDEEASS